MELVVGAFAGDRVVERRAVDVLDADVGVALGGPVLAAAGPEIDLNAPLESVYNIGVIAAAAVDPVGAAAALQRVVAVKSKDRSSAPEVPYKVSALLVPLIVAMVLSF